MSIKIPEGMHLQHYKYKMYPTYDQKKFLNKCIDINRFVYNWALNREIETYQLYVDGASDISFLSKYDLEHEFTKLRNDESNSFLRDIPHISARNAIGNAYNAFIMYFRKRAKFPKYKSKKKSRQSYKTRYDRAYFSDDFLKIEGLNDKIQIKIHTGYNKHTTPTLYNTVIVRDNFNNYWFCFAILEPDVHIKASEFKQEAIGIDLNLRKRIVLSTGEFFIGPSLKQQRKKYNRLFRKITKDKKRFKLLEKTNPDAQPSKRSEKRLLAFRKKSRHIADIAENFIQNVTKIIVNKFPKTIVMEDLDVEEMHRNHGVAKYIFTDHSNFGRIREVMKYKCENNGIKFLLADRHFPSSQLCSNCGHRQKVWNDRIYKCPICGISIDRDVNAAINLSKLAYTM